jgi:hypothetical protein
MGRDPGHAGIVRGKLAPVAEGLFLGDYMGLAMRGSGFAAAFTQTETTHPASIFVRPLTP